MYPKCTKTRLRASVKSKFSWRIPRTHVKRGWRWGKEERGGKERGCHGPDQLWEEIDANAVGRSPWGKQCDCLPVVSYPGFSLAFIVLSFFIMVVLLCCLTIVFCVFVVLVSSSVFAKCSARKTRLRTPISRDYLHKDNDKEHFCVDLVYYTAR